MDDFEDRRVRQLRRLRTASKTVTWYVPRRLTWPEHRAVLTQAKEHAHETGDTIVIQKEDPDYVD